MRALVLLVLAACTDAASSDSGLSAVLHVEAAQYRPGGFPRDTGGPPIAQVSTQSSAVVIGAFDGVGRGVLAPNATASVLAIEGIDGAWIIPAGVPDLDTEGQPVARFAFGVIGDITPGPFTLVMAASDATGNFGAPATTTIVAAEAVPPTGQLVLGLAWSGPADLDIHVVDALGGEAWSDKPNTMIPPPPGTPIDPNSMEHLKHGQLDRDANRACTRQTSPSEHVIWQMPPQPGEYIVRVDTRSMCGAASANWYVEAYVLGADGAMELVGAARGTATPADTLHGLDQLGLGRAGLGVTALRLTL